MACVLTSPVLVLNRNFCAVQVTIAKRALVLLYSGHGRAMDERGELFDFDQWRALPVRPVVDDAVPIIGGALRVPRVLHLATYDRLPRAAVRLTRQNLMIRDAHQCQYCHRKLPPRDLNVDHVIPRSRGGPDSWENLVVSCRPCNLRKGSKTPDEANMHLARRPHRPRWTIAAQILCRGQRYAEWEPYLEAG
jgi:5-methylcytosine-specific restriction endonuclease McrA